MTITNFNYEGSYLPGVICNIVVKADLGRSRPPQADLPVDLNGNFRCLPRAHIGRSPGRPPPTDLPVDLNGNFGCGIPLELILTDHLADLANGPH